MEPIQAISPLEVCATVKVVAETTEANPHGYHLINKSDFDPEQHMLFEGEDMKGGDPSAMTVADLRAALTAKGIEFENNAKKAKLVALYVAANE